MSPGKTGIMDRVALRLADTVLAHPWKVVLITLLLVAAAGGGAQHLEFANNYRVFFSPENPELVAFEEFQATYTKNDNILFVLQPAAGDVFAPELLSDIEWLTAEASRIPYAIRVDSVTNFQHSWADGDELTVEDLVRDAPSMAVNELSRRREIALAEPLLRDNLLSPDARTTGVNVTLQYPEESLTEVPAAVSHARDLAQQLRARQPGLTVALSGVSMLNNAFAEAGEQDAMSLMPAMFLVLVIFMLLVLRSLAGTAGTLAVIAFATVTAMGLAGYAGLKLNPISVTAVVIIMTLGLADSVHVLVTVRQTLSEGRSKIDALRESLRVNLVALIVTSVTTIIGFLALNFSDAPPFRDMGNITAVGIAAALLYSVVFLPAFLSLVPLRAPAPSSGQHGMAAPLGALAELVIRRHRAVLTTMVILAVALMAMVPLVDLNDEFVKYFDYRVEFRGDAEWGMENLNGIYLIEYSVEADGPEGISDPVYLENLERFTGWLRQQPEEQHVYSYTDVIKRLNKNMHGDDDGWYRMPDDRQLGAQYLLLYELSLPYGLDLNDRISIDKSATRVTATVGDLPTSAIRELLDRSKNWLRAETPAYMHAEPTGASVMFAYISQRNIESMLGGNVVAVLLISAVIMLALWSVSIGALSLIPNAVPILMTFGVWALLVGQVGMAAATVSATSLGIVVDDSVHFLTKYLRARREKGLDQADAVRYAFDTVGRALVSTTVILSFGFAVLAFSSFRINAQMGLLTAIAVLLALVTDLLLLPALLLIGHKSTAKETDMTISSTNWRLGGAPTALALAALLGAGTSVAYAQSTADPINGPGRTPTAAEKGYQIAARADRSDRGYLDSDVELTMLLRNAAGKETTRVLRILTLEVPQDDLGDRSLVVFDSPADIEGTALLSHAKILDPDDQWLYLPALKRVKRISSVNKSGPFVGSEFAFEDFTALELEKYEYLFVGQEPCGELTCDVLKRTPRYEHSGYTKQVSWVDQRDFQIRKVDFYGRRGELLKTLELTDYRQYDGAYWRPLLMRMVNHQTGKSTDLNYTDYRFGNGLGESDFVRGALQRLR